jgi:sugar lactone lactonase YvrE
MHMRAQSVCSIFVLATSSLLFACVESGASSGTGEDDGTTTTAATTGGSGSGGDDATSTTTGNGPSTTAGSGGDPGSGGSGGEGSGAEVISAFGAGELPEGLVLRGGEALVGMAMTGVIESVSLSDGARSAFGQLPFTPPAGTSFMTGLSVSLDGLSVQAAFASFTEEAAPGVYTFPADGGEGVLFGSHPEMLFPNGLAWDPEELLEPKLYVSDSALGAIFVVDGLTGETDLVVTDPILLGGGPCGSGDVEVGANGLYYVGDDLYVASTDQGVVVRFDINDGEAGPPQIVAGPDCDLLAGIDGISRDSNGTYIGVVNRADRVVRIHPESGVVDNELEGGALDFPASIARSEDGDFIVTSFALESGAEGAPGLVRVILP